MGEVGRCPFSGTRGVEWEYFGSNTKTLYELSNLWATIVELRGIQFPSSEHAFQAMCRVHPEDWNRFSCQGDLGSLNGLQLLVSPKKTEKAIAYWKKKKMVGIVAKMAVKRDVAKRLGLKLLRPHEKDHDLDEVQTLFEEILVHKYTTNAVALKALAASDNKYLIEFDRGAGRRTLAGDPPLWSGLVKEGCLYGLNLQGRIHMKVRKLLRQRGVLG
jgi:predicted NAD-dependent protein-ADP-ribosyltransferase YbiA (DUF1768 family)